MSWRLVDSDALGPARSAATDEAILLARGGGAVPDTLHLYRRSAPTVSLGYFQRAAESVDLAAAERLGVALVRRLSGGSAIYTDPEQLIYTAVVTEDSMPEAPQETFALLCRGVVLGLQELGLAATFKPVNDVLVGGRKISGSAQVRRHGVVLQHGTLLVRTDYRRMFAVLRSSKRSRDEMTSLTEELGTAPPLSEVKRAVVRGFSAALGAEIVPGRLTDDEKKNVDDLVRTKYGDPAYTFRL